MQVQVERKPTYNILNNLIVPIATANKQADTSFVKLLAYKNGSEKVVLSAFNKISCDLIEAELGAEVTRSGSVLLRAEHLRNVMGNSKDEQIKLERAENRINIKSEGRTGHMPIGAEDYAYSMPSFGSSPHQIEMSSSVLLRDLLSRVQGSMSPDPFESNSSFCSIVLKFAEGKLTAYAGHQYAAARASFAVNTEFEGELAIPRRAVDTILSILKLGDGPVTIGFGSNSISVRSGAIRYSTVTYAPKPVDWEQVLTIKGSKFIKAQSSELLGAIKSITPAFGSGDHYKNILACMFTEDAVWFKASEIGELKSHIKCQSNLSDKVIMGFTLPYALDALSGHGEVEIRFDGPQQGVFFVSQDDPYSTIKLVMPARLR
jgi:DNA polymerase III sliding clamp (beta) subunit (PCNA family)